MDDKPFKAEPFDLTDWVQERIGSRPAYHSWVRHYYSDEHIKAMIDMNSWYPMNKINGKDK